MLEKKIEIVEAKTSYAVAYVQGTMYSWMLDVERVDELCPKQPIYKKKDAVRYAVEQAIRYNVFRDYNIEERADAFDMDEEELENVADWDEIFKMFDYKGGTEDSPFKDYASIDEWANQFFNDGQYFIPADGNTYEDANYFVVVVRHIKSTEDSDIYTVVL